MLIRIERPRDFFHRLGADAEVGLLATYRSCTWIHEYVFPGGMLPSPEEVGSGRQG
ncbi:hypothetical protein [Saccharopolyspora sp. NPDC002686]|uniref:hypothetical protein n=1 Tax=Saccharopolyspora sp. NPDC002686 TaxID=3154541 RepID=UPI003325E27B